MPTVPPSPLAAARRWSQQRRADRRARPGSAMLALGTLVVGLVAAPAVDDGGDAPEATTRTVVLEPVEATTADERVTAAGAGHTAHDGDGWLERAPVPAGAAVLVGADWGGAPDVEVQVRAHDGVAWGEWLDVTHDVEHAPDPGTAEAARVAPHASDPVWIGRSTQVQLRTRGEVGEVELSLVDIAGDLDWTPPELDAAPGAALAATDQPTILSRASWGADESRVKHRPREFNRANFAIVHHTAGSNDYTAAEADDVIRSIYAYHLSRGWDDIAYNFLVDIHGRVWEGRAGGIDRPVIGGHAAGFNGGSVGVSAMGSFQVTEPPVAMVQAIEDLLAWKLDLHHLDPHGHSEEVAGGGSSNRFDEGERVTLPTIIGHRHTNATSCPGDKLYEHVAGLNGDVSFADRVDSVGHPKAYGGPPQDREQPVHGVRPRWDVEFTDTVTWQLSIVDEAGRAVRRGAEQGVTEMHVAWDMRDDRGQLVQPGRYVAQVDARNALGEVVTPVRTVLEVTPAAERVAGPGRVETAVELSRWAFDDAERVVLASSEAFPDALVAGPLAGSLDAPILLVPSTGLPDAVVDEIRRLTARGAYIVGGASRIPAGIEQQLRERAGITSVTRYAGADRFETAAKVARAVITREHPTEALLALGRHADESRAFPDALAAGAFGADQRAPVLLVAGEGVPGPIHEVLTSRPWADGVVAFGGFSALPQATVDAAARAAGAKAAAGRRAGTPAPVTRFRGADRYDTARVAAEELLRRWEQQVAEDGPSPYAEPTGLEVVLASGRNWPDALGASAAAVERGAVFVLVDDLSMDRSEATRQFLRAHAAEAAHGVVSGGRGAVSDAVLLAVADEVAAAGPSTEPGERWPGDSAGGRLTFPFPLPSDEPSPEPTDSPPPSPSASPSPSGSPSATPAEGDPSPSPTATGGTVAPWSSRRH